MVDIPAGSLPIVQRIYEQVHQRYENSDENNVKRKRRKYFAMGVLMTVYFFTIYLTVDINAITLQSFIDVAKSGFLALCIAVLALSAMSLQDRVEFPCEHCRKHFDALVTWRCKNCGTENNKADLTLETLLSFFKKDQHDGNDTLNPCVGPCMYEKCHHFPSSIFCPACGRENILNPIQHEISPEPASIDFYEPSRFLARRKKAATHIRTPLPKKEILQFKESLADKNLI